MFKKRDFDATKHETEFESLTDHELNKQLEEVNCLICRKPSWKQINPKLKNSTESNMLLCKGIELMLTNLPSPLEKRPQWMLISTSLLKSQSPTSILQPSSTPKWQTSFPWKRVPSLMMMTLKRKCSNEELI